MKIHMVKQGDTLYLIAKKYNVPLEEIVKANPEISNPDVIDVGMKVKIPTQSQSAMEVIHHHIVQQGDTLWKLSKAWGIQLSDIIKLNPQLKNPNALLTGEVVKIPKPAHGAEAAPMENVQAHASSGGKAHTGVISSSGGKANTSVQPVEEEPVPLPAPVAPIELAPEPVPLPAPAPAMPQPEVKPIYGVHIHEHVNLFQQFPIPAVQVATHAEKPVAAEHHHPYGYGMQQPQVQAQETYTGYGQPYGQEAQTGYGQPYSISPLGGNVAGNWGGLYGNQDVSFSNVVEGSNSVPGISAPSQMSMKSASGCQCGSKSMYGSPSHANAPMVMGTGYMDDKMPYGAWPYAAGPYEQHGVMQQAVSPFGNYPGMQATPYYGLPMGDISAGVNPLAGGIPGVYNAPYLDAQYGAMPPIPPVPAMPPIPPIPPLGPMREDGEQQRSVFGVDEAEVKSVAAKKRQAKPKAKLESVRQSKPRRKESLPWIKW